MMRHYFQIIAVALCALAGHAFAQTTLPAGASIEQQALLPSTRIASPTAPRAAGGGSSEIVSVPQLFTGLFIVLSLIFLAKWLVPRFWPSVVAQRNGAVRILGRTPVSPKNQIVLVQVGQRVLVIGESAGQLATLSTIDDSDEVALLVGKAAARPEREAASPFAAALDESNRAYVGETAPAELPVEATEEKPSGELSDLISKVRGLARQLGRS